MPSKKQAPEATTIQVKLVRSPIGYNKTQKATVQALGLTKLHQVVEKNDSPAIRGMINRVSHLVEVVE
jgi:large subunit ribosomal protein L30